LFCSFFGPPGDHIAGRRYLPYQNYTMNLKIGTLLSSELILKKADKLLKNILKRKR
jgi:hypothetical protein